MLVVVSGSGHVHDFALLKQAHLRVTQEIETYGAAGSHGLSTLWVTGWTPIKTPKHRDWTLDEKADTRELARLRISLEQVNRRCQIFRRVNETSRGKHRQYQKTWTVVAALVNLRSVG
jgi:hypothetical protein